MQLYTASARRQTLYVVCRGGPAPQHLRLELQLQAQQLSLLLERLETAPCAGMCPASRGRPVDNAQRQHHCHEVNTDKNHLHVNSGLAARGSVSAMEHCLAAIRHAYASRHALQSPGNEMPIQACSISVLRAAAAIWNSKHIGCPCTPASDSPARSTMRAVAHPPKCAGPTPPSWRTGAASA